MTKLLEKAFAAAAKLPDKEQEALAALLLEEIESERKWTDSFAKSQDKLAAMAREALAEHHKGQTKPLTKDSDLAHD